MVTPDQWDGVNRSKVKIFRNGHVAYQIKGENEMQQHCSKYFARRPTALGVGLIGQNLTFSENGHVAYQIKVNDECINMVADILPATPPPPPDYFGGVKRSKFNFIRTRSCCI